MTTPGPWFVYIVRSGDGFLYTGVTTDVERRLSEHKASSSISEANSAGRSKGAKYFRSKTNLSLVFQYQVANRSIAQKLEYRIKQLDKPQKEALVEGSLPVTEVMATIDAGS